MKIQLEVKASTNEKRRFIGQADITPMVELASEMLDRVTFVLIQARLADLEAAEHDARIEEAADMRRTAR